MSQTNPFGDGFLTTTMDAITNWARANALWPMPMGLSCCAIEMMAMAGPKYDVSRFGSEVFRMSPRQSDLMIVAGTVTYKMSHVVKKIWDQMPDPKWCIAMGACSSSGGMFRSYPVVQGIDQFIPVDVYVPGCPPRPDAVIHALMEIQEKIKNQRYSFRDAILTEEGLAKLDKLADAEKERMSIKA
ncbi:MAG: NADH-quinone oxidoreductase subunit B [[Candidatus Thermochlorobacteriaceae] bacterium GBChlB]|jgi:NADH-quinone oxidoreductase subunit B|nr:MAG: NADH-quinone oxidoreductase subunit B [[Candidatus Thermochlorobacteriaceae] bacterium GBChlB]